MCKTIGLLTTSLGGPLKSYENAVTRALSELVRERGCRLVVYSGGAPAREMGFESIRNFVYELVSDKSIDGLFILSASLSLYISPEEFVSFFQRFHPLPMVSIGLAMPGLHGVTIDNRRYMRDLTEHLIKVHGLHSPLYLGGPVNNLEARERLAGYREAIARNGISADSRMILEGTFLRDSGYRLIRDYLREANPPFDAVVCANDEMAVGVRDHLSEKGLKAPRDYLLTGFDDLEVAALVDPPLTTVHQPVYEMARRACSSLCDHLLLGKPIENSVCPIKLVIRDSCGCGIRPPRIEDVLPADVIDHNLPVADIFAASVSHLGERNRDFMNTAFQKLFDSLTKGTGGARYAENLDLFRSILAQSEQIPVEVRYWHGAVVVLETHFSDTGLIPSKFWEGLRFLVSDAENASIRRQRLMSERLESYLRLISEELVNTYRVEDLKTVLEYHLPGLCVISLEIEIFEKDPFDMRRVYPLLRWNRTQGALLCNNEKGLATDDLLNAKISASEGFPIIEALTFRNEVIGVLFLDLDKPDGTVSNSLREMIGGALKNIDLWKQTSERTRLLEMLYQTEKSLAAWPDEMMAMEITQRGISSWLHNPWSMVWLGDRDSEILTARLGLQEGVRIAGNDLPPLHLNDAIRVGNFETGDYRGIRIPLVTQGRVSGMVDVGFSKKENFRFDASIIKNLGLFVDQLSLALSNAHLYRETIQSAEHIRELNRDLAMKLRRITSLRAIDVAITESSVDGEIYGVLLDQIQRELGCDAVSLLLYNREDDVLVFAESRGFMTDALKFTHLPMGKGTAGRAALERKQIFIEDVSHKPETLSKAPLLHEEGFQAYCAAPLLSRGELKGVLELFNRSPLHPDQEWRDFLEVLTGQAAIALDHCTLIAGLQSANIELLAAYDATIEGWSRALDLRDHETEGHSKRVAAMCEQLGKELGLDGDSLLHLHRGALLHDIGKVAIPDSILLKPGKLTDEEMRIMRKHPDYARQILSSIDFLKPVLSIPGDHHEKWDGSGYPRGLKGEEIPLYARIFALVDVWDALTSDRPYRNAWPEQKVAEYIHSLSGTHFDPAITPVFLRLRGYSFD